MDWKKIAEDNTILRCVVGSAAYGLSVGNTGDRDEKGVCIEPLEAFAGFNKFEQYEYRTAAEREGRNDAPSAPGDLDLTIYSLQKFLRLALQGNPTIIELLFIKDCVKSNAAGRQLQELAPLIISRQCGRACLGYAQAQKFRLLSPLLDDENRPKEPWLEKLAERFGWKLRKQGGKDVNRPELVKQFGFDTKYAMHMLRLGYQGVELLTTGRLVFPIQENTRDVLRAVRGGELSLPEVLEFAGTLEGDLSNLLQSSKLSEQPHTEAVEDWMIDRYWQWWKAQRVLKDRLFHNMLVC